MLQKDPPTADEKSSEDDEVASTVCKDEDGNGTAVNDPASTTANVKIPTFPWDGTVVNPASNLGTTNPLDDNVVKEPTDVVLEILSYDDADGIDAD